MHLCIYFVIMHIAHFYLVLQTYICSAEGHLIAILNFAQYAVQNCQTSFGQVLSNSIYEIIIQMTLVGTVLKSTLTFWLGK